jgi:hypothetical protein
MIVKSKQTQSSSAMTFEQSENSLQYRSVSKAAILSIVFAILGVLSFLGAVFVILPLLGVGFGIAGYMNVKRFPLELIGKKAASIGLIASVLLFVGSAGTHAYVHYTEVPEGYQRISFYDLKPNTMTQKFYSEKADAFDGKKVFIRGYVRPSDKKRDLKQFIMVGDWGDCCFGGNPEMTDIVAISIKTDDTVDYGLGVRKIGGTFRLNTRPRPNADPEVPQIVYEIEADHVR